MKINYKYILGIQCFANYESGAAILRINEKTQDYDYVAISEERLIRKKYNYDFPLHSIQYCLDYYNIEIKNIDFLVSDIIREPTWIRSGPSYNLKEFDYLKLKFKIKKKKIIQISHHLAHAASTYYTSGFKKSAILIVDGNGTDLETNSFWKGKDKKIFLYDVYKGRGLGQLYGSITRNCLNLGVGGEGKTMGLAPYGKKGKKFLNFKSTTYDGVKTDYSEFMRRQPFTDILSLEKKIFHKKFNINFPLRKKQQDITKGIWPKIAYDLQCEAERNLTKLGKSLEKIDSTKNICVAGGVALNSVANKIMFDKTNFKNIFVFPGCSDAGVPLGLTLWGAYNIRKIKPPKLKKLKNAYTGKNYTDDEAEFYFKKFKIKFEKTTLSKVALKISQGKVIGWFQGGSEYGPRALGNRSILADSRKAEMRDLVNEKVKHREKYRPFAPSVLEEDAKQYFDLNQESPYMLLVAKVKKPKVTPSISHVDNTARVQTVNKTQNKKFYNLILEFKKITGVGCILNTSFNDAGEPIVETPLDALITFFGTKMDYLVINNFIIKKTDNKNVKRDDLINFRNKKINQYYKKSLKNLINKYSIKERDKYFRNEKKNAIWNTIKKPVYDLEKQIKIWKSNNKTSIIIIGTYDHTKFLLKKFPKLKDLKIKYFIPYNKLNDDVNDKNTKHNFGYKTKKMGEYISKKNTIYLISSYEFSYDIEYELLKNKISNYYKIYTGYSRDLMTCFKLNKKRI